MTLLTTGVPSEDIAIALNIDRDGGEYNPRSPFIALHPLTLRRSDKLKVAVWVRAHNLVTLVALIVFVSGVADNPDNPDNPNNPDIYIHSYDNPANPDSPDNPDNPLYSFL